MNKERQRIIKEKVERAKGLAKSKLPTKVNILSLDQATNCGLAWEIVGKPWEVTTWNLSVKTQESNGVKWFRFESKLREFIVKNKIQLVTYELPSGQHMGAKIHSAKLIAIIEKLAAELSIEYLEHSASSIKKFATGNGGAKKDAVIKAAQEKLGYKGNNDNEADALWMLMITKKEFN